MNDIKTKTEDKGDKIVMTLEVPGLKKHSLKINIDDKFIKLEYDAKKINEKKDKNGKVIYRSQSHRHFAKILSVPAGVDTAKATTDVKGDKIIITFPKHQI